MEEPLRNGVMNQKFTVHRGGELKTIKTSACPVAQIVVIWLATYGRV